MQLEVKQSPKDAGRARRKPKKIWVDKQSDFTIILLKNG